jgi:hypothetical protein
MQVKSSEESLVRDLEVPLPQSEPFQTLSVLLRVLAELPPQKDAGTIEHKASIILHANNKFTDIKFMVVQEPQHRRFLFLLIPSHFNPVLIAFSG